MDLVQKASEELAKVAVWSEDSLGYAREQGRRKLVWLLGVVKADVEFEEAWLAVPSGKHLGPTRGGAWEEVGHNNERRIDTAGDELKGEREEEKRQARIAAWELFMEMELQELRLRQDGQLGKLLGKTLPGEPPAALRWLAEEDRRQAQDGLVALIKGGKVSYKHVEELCEGDMSARAAANRMRTMWLKERRDGWLAGGSGSRT